MVSRKSGTKKTVKSTGKQFTLDMVVAKKPTVKKTAAKKPTTKKPTAVKKSTAVKKTTVKKTATKKPTIKKTTVKKTTAVKPTAKKTTAVKKSTTPKKSTAKKTAKYNCKLYVDGIFEKSFKADSYDEIEREKRIAYQETGADEVEVKVESSEFANVKKSLVGRKPVIKKPNDDYYIVRQPTKRFNPKKIVEYEVENDDHTFGENIKSIEKARMIAAYYCGEGDIMYIIGYNAIHDDIYIERLKWSINYATNTVSGFYCERTIGHNTDDDEYEEYCKIDPKTGKIIDTRSWYSEHF